MERISGTLKINALQKVMTDKFTALRAMVDFVGECDNHTLYNPFTGVMLMTSDDDDSTFTEALRLEHPVDIVSEIAWNKYCGII